MANQQRLPLAEYEAINELISSQGWEVFIRRVLAPKVESIRRVFDNADLTETDYRQAIHTRHQLRGLFEDLYGLAEHRRESNAKIELPTALEQLFKP